MEKISYVVLGDSREAEFETKEQAIEFAKKNLTKEMCEYEGFCIFKKSTKDNGEWDQVDSDENFIWCSDLLK